MGIKTRSRTLEPILHDQPRERQRRRRAAHVFLHQFHAVGGFDVEAAGVEHHAFADQRHLRGVRPSPDEVDQPRRLGRRRPDRRDERKAFLERLAGDDMRLGAEGAR